MTIYHDGASIPSAAPKDPDSTVWYGFIYPLREDEIILNTSWLIDGVAVNTGDTVNGMTYLGQTFDQASGEVSAKFSGGTLGIKYKLTNRLGTSYTDSDDRSIYVTVVEL